MFKVRKEKNQRIYDCLYRTLKRKCLLYVRSQRLHSYINGSLNDKSINSNSFSICYIEFPFSKHLFSLSNCMSPHIVILWYDINVYSMNYMHKIYCGNKRPNDCVIWWKKPCKHCILKICLSSIRSIGCKRQATHATWHNITLK